MRPLRLLFILCLGVWQCSTALLGGEFRLNNGDIVRGEPVSFNDDGMVVRLEIGGHSPRISWSKLTQESLQQLQQNPQAAKFVEPFIDVPPVPKEKKVKKDIVVKPVVRVEQVAKPSLASSLTTPAGLAICLILLLGNVYAAYQIAIYRHRSPAMVCGLAVVLPVIAPAAILAMPSAMAPETDAVLEPAATAQAAGKATTGPLAKVPMASGLSIAQADKSAAPSTAAPTTQTFKRGEFTFNRRFIETKFPGFFRVVQSENEKDLILAVRAAKDEYIAKRITRISSNEMHLALVRGTEVSVPFAEIIEIQLRHKDVKA